MFGRSLFSDPFFNLHQQHMQDMNRMFADPFGGGIDPFQQHSIMAPPLIAGVPPMGNHNHHQQPHEQMQLSPFGSPFLQPSLFGGGLLGGGMVGMNNMMADMNRQFAALENGAGAAIPVGGQAAQQGMSHHSVMTFSSTGNGPPKVYEASSSTRFGPGQVKETRKTERNSETGLEKMAVGRHIGEKGHVMEKSRNRRTGDEEENQEYLNLEEEELGQFDNQWKQKQPQHFAHSRGSSSRHRGIGHRSSSHRNDPLAISDSAHGQRQQQRRHRGTPRHHLE